MAATDRTTDSLIATGGKGETGWRNKRISIFTFGPRTREWKQKIWLDRKKDRRERYTLTQTAKIFV